MSEYAEFVDVDNDWTQYAQVGQCHNLGDEVRELRKQVQELTQKNELQYRELRYWRDAHYTLAQAAAKVRCLYGWGVNTTNDEGLALACKDILSLRFRVHALKKRNKKLLAWKQKAVRLVGPFAIVDTE